jgi:hypothetical protein
MCSAIAKDEATYMLYNRKCSDATDVKVQVPAHEQHGHNQRYKQTSKES